MVGHEAMKRGKTGALEIQINWIFVLIAGAIIGGTAVALIRRKNVNAKQKTFVATKKQPDPSKSQP